MLVMGDEGQVEEKIAFVVRMYSNMLQPVPC